MLPSALLLGCAPVIAPPDDASRTATAAPLSEPIAEAVRFTAADGASLACRRYPSAGAAPVLLIHGLAINVDSWDLPDMTGADYSYRSLTSLLREAGFDVWLLNLRGHGNGETRSRPPPGQADWTIDHFALYDVPAAVAEIVATTGRQPFVIASSLGAMSLAAWLEGVTWAESATESIGAVAAPQSGRLVADPQEAAERQAQLAGAVFVAFPAAPRWPQSPIDEAGRVVWGSLIAGILTAATDSNVVFESAAQSSMLQGAVDLYGTMPLRLLRPNEQLEAWEDQLPPPLATFLDDIDRSLFAFSAGLVGTFNGESTGRFDVILAARGTVLEDVEAGVLRQFGRSIRARAFVSELSEPPLIYSEHYTSIALPTLVVLGDRDRNANADVARAVFFDALAARDKMIRVFPDIGHGEFEMAPIATELVYPEILAWLTARDISP